LGKHLDVSERWAGIFAKVLFPFFDNILVQTPLFDEEVSKLQDKMVWKFEKGFAKEAKRES